MQITLEQKKLALDIYESVETLGPKLGPMIEAALPQDEYIRYRNITEQVLPNIEKINALWEDFVKACIREGLV